MAIPKTLKEPLPFLISEISFANVDHSFRPKQKTILRNWIHKTIEKEGLLSGTLSFNFCTDKHLLKMNREFLQHDYYTDIITFDFCENKIVSGDIYISVDRVKENAKTMGVLFPTEMKRVIIHGVLHLCGYKDKKPAEAKQMRQKEDYYLSLLK
jgi:probable rRNA maturation factor